MEDSALFPALMKNKSKFVIGDENKTAGTASPQPAGMTSNSNSAAAATNSGGGSSSSGVGRRTSTHRHHVKRRSLGHARIRPLTGKHYYVNHTSLTDTEAGEDEDEDGGVRPAPLRRSQSQRSLRRMDMLQPMMPLRRPPAQAAVSPSPPSLQNNISSSDSPVSSVYSSNPSLRLSTMPSAVAEPIEQALHVVAHNLVVPETRGGAYSVAQEVVTMSTSPRSTPRSTLTASPSAACRNTLRSQFITQRHDPASSPVELVDREYECIKQYQDPMAESLIRCALKKRRASVSRTLSTSAIVHPHPPPHQLLSQTLQRRRQQEQQQQKPASSASFPLLQHQYVHHTVPRPSSSNPVKSNGILGSLWERMMHGV